MEYVLMSHHSKHHFITQYILLRGTAVNEFYRMIQMGVAIVRFFLVGRLWEFYNMKYVPYCD